METKTFKTKNIELKEEGEGKFSAVFATLDVIDKDGDIILPGAIQTGQKVRISAYNHSSWADALPVGKGVITEQDNELIVDGQFFIDTQAGQETYKTVKNLEELTEYSFGFDITDAEYGEREGKSVQFIKGLNVYEVSPVLLGAGINTRTLEVKTGNQKYKLKQAVPTHETKTTDTEWDGAANEDRLTNDGSYAIYRNMYAWVDPGGERENKTSYKFPHHNVDADGQPGPANVGACIATIAALNGARGGADIPDSDREGVWEHAAKHLRDAGENVPDLKAKGVPFVKEARDVRDGVVKLLGRCHDIIELRREKGKNKPIGDESKGAVLEVRDDLQKAVEEIDRMFANNSEGAGDDEVIKAYLEHVKNTYIGDSNE